MSDLAPEELNSLAKRTLDAAFRVHSAQLVSYLKLADRRLGLLLNFNVERLRDGIYRRVNRF